jgi:hypothetical protein
MLSILRGLGSALSFGVPDDEFAGLAWGERFESGNDTGRVIGSGTGLFDELVPGSMLLFGDGGDVGSGLVDDAEVP